MNDNNIGKKFGKLTVLKFHHFDKHNYKHYLFRCECGNEKIINFSNVKSGKTKSCGCLYKTSSSTFKNKTNQYIEEKNKMIGISTNTKSEFYFDKEDYERVKKYSWYEQKNGYIVHKDRDKKMILLHRYILNADSNHIVDHINHNKKDNRKFNLRLTDYQVNNLNRSKLPKGIYKHKVSNRYYYTVDLHGYRGSFKSYEEAEKIRNQVIQNEYLPLR